MIYRLANCVAVKPCLYKNEGIQDQNRGQGAEEEM